MAGAIPAQAAALPSLSIRPPGNADYARYGAGGMLTLYVRRILCDWMVSTGAMIAMWMPIMAPYFPTFGHSIANMALFPSPSSWAVTFRSWTTSSGPDPDIGRQHPSAASPPPGRCCKRPAVPSSKAGNGHIEAIGGPDTIRTCDLRLRRATLYPTELRVQHTPSRMRPHPIPAFPANLNRWLHHGQVRSRSASCSTVRRVGPSATPGG
jgi:hypothetical protein